MSENHKLDLQTGFKQRTVDIASILKAANIPAWGKPKGRHLFDRIDQPVQYFHDQNKQEMWLYNRRILTAPSTEVLAMDDNYNIIHGVNFASADYLGLAKNEPAKEAAIEAATNFGCNSAGSPLAFGATKYYMQLKQELAEFWGVKSLLIYSAGWLAGFGVIKGLIKDHDHVIMDRLSHNCLQEGVNASTKNIHKFNHLDQAEMTKMVQDVRKKDPENAILVVTEGLFSMDSDSPDLIAYQRVCKQNNAFLLIDCAHDFGHIGEKGRGVWQVQGLKDLSNVLLVGTGSKCLSTNIGFVGCDNPNVIEYLKYYSSAYMFTNAINPIQAATSLANLGILRSEQGRQLRKKVLQNYHYLKGELSKNGRVVFGNPCAILPVFIGNEVVSRLVSRLMMDMGVHVNGIEFPVVKLGQARLRVSVMPQHTKEHLDTFARVFERALKKANQIFERQMKVYQEQMREQQTAKL